jgi:broad specificity phosphatase PhoE
LPFDRLRNTSLTTLEIDGTPILRVFNDASHTITRSHSDEDGTVVALIRHGETEANLTGRWQGVTDGPLSSRGRAQAEALASHYDGIAHIYTSHLSRARLTGAALAAASGVELTERPDLHEIDFGEWEDLTAEEARARHREEWDAIYVHHRDLPRGRTGETAGGAGQRIAAAVEEIAAAHPGARVAAVTHGGAIRAYAAAVVGLGFDNRSHLALPGNVEVTHVRMAGVGPVLAAYNMRPGH